MRRRQHVNPLGLAFETIRDQPPAVEGKTVELEVGCADAQFLFERARIQPQKKYLGIEIREDLVRDVNRRAEAMGAPVTAVFANANNHLSTLLPKSSVERAYLNFPDPWFKRRHRKRRMIDARLVDALGAVMAPEGDLFVQTDVWSVALDALEVLESRPDLFENVSGQWGFWHLGNPFGARSWREQSCEEQGTKIWRIRYRRVDAAFE